MSTLTRWIAVPYQMHCYFISYFIIPTLENYSLSTVPESWKCLHVGSKEVYSSVVTSVCVVCELDLQRVCGL